MSDYECTAIGIADTTVLMAAPMVNQSDLPFRILVRRYNASLAYTQMLDPDRILNNQEYLEFHLRGLGEPGLDRPVVVQFGSDNAANIVQAGKKIQSYCDGIDLNLGCPQRHAEEAHYGAYLLGRRDWPLVESIVSAMSHSLIVPTSAKLRLCQPAPMTAELGQRLEAAGASWIALHPRHTSARKRRQGTAFLDEVNRLKENVQVPVVSNGNVRVWQDVQDNRAATGADGIMVGETLLGNPCLFANKVPDPIEISLEYLDICEEHSETATIDTIRTHIRHFIEFQCGRRTWFTKFRNQLGACNTAEEVKYLVSIKVKRWRGNTTGNSKDEGELNVRADVQELSLGLNDLKF